ncbi:MAG: DUF962 domain-containing protein [Gammaproteobacteria bacterium]|nr:DUF962 domain-containing protein [Gammaproteobacteria bacterium]MDH4254327.1 DUF962 domain-containing protein [Gammaproteobacteria bacterium]MDH5309621.1 DUF962 domain-containing protein [Gammaproteobacteria bacterium]
MNRNTRLMDMLVGYAASHQHPFNVGVHLLGIPTIMLGIFIAFSWLEIRIDGFGFNLAHVAALGLFLFYLTLDAVFAFVYLVVGMAVAVLATEIGKAPLPVSGGVAAATFFGGYALQFVGHAVEKSMPVLVRHPVQANLAAPFFTIVEICGLMGLREELFSEVQAQVAERRRLETTG